MPQNPSSSIGVLLADSSQMQLQLLTSALRRRPEFNVASCPLDADLVLQMLASVPVHVLVLGIGHPDSSLDEMALLRRLHVSYPQVAKVVLLESASRELVVNAFRSGARGLFCL